jgi:hypothetical protein
VKLTLVPRAGADGKVRVAVDRAFVDRVQVRRVDPAPAWVEVRSDSHVYVFHADVSPGRLTFTIHYEPDRFGPLRLRAAVDQGPSIELRQLVYP